MRYSIAICLAAAAVAACTNRAGNNGAAASGPANGIANAATPAPAPTGNATVGSNVAATASTYTARGFEPGWALTIVPGGQIVFQQQDGPNHTVPAPLPVPQGGGVLKYTAPPLTILVTPTPCVFVDDQTYSDTVQVTVGAQTLNGCGG